MQFANESQKTPGEGVPDTLALALLTNVYSYEIPIGTKGFNVQMRNGNSFKINFSNTEGDLTKYSSVGAGGYWNKEGILINSKMFINIQTSANAEVAEIQLWR